jgi:hypothetical protein
MHAAMGFGHPACPLEDQRLRSVEGGKISGAAGIVAEFDLQNRSGVGEGLSRLCQIGFGLRPHRSTPSRRISCISGVRCR